MIKTTVRFGTLPCQLSSAEYVGGRTISPNRANAGNNVGGASRWRSIPSKTSTNLSLPANRHFSRTASTLTVSQLPGSNPLPSSSTSCGMLSLQAAIVRSSRCRVVMHSSDRTMACGTSMASNTFSTAKLFPVASSPWTTRVDGLGTLGWPLC